MQGDDRALRPKRERFGLFLGPLFAVALIIVGPPESMEAIEIIVSLQQLLDT